jgi:ParB family chromosome partitioning protein
MTVAAIEEHKPAEKRRALGRGLDSLLPSGPRVVPPQPSPQNPPANGPQVVPPPPSSVSGQATGAAVPGNIAASATGLPAVHGVAPYEIAEIPLELIDDNPYQTRSSFDEAALQELSESIRAQGLAQPVVVRPQRDGRYILVLGERRCRASKLAGKTTVPAIVRTLGDEQAAEMTIVENLQRQDLNCLEQAHAFARLSREFNLTQEQIGKRTGTSRESVANYLRLLKLPQGILDLIGQGKLGFSEARVLLEASPFLDSAALQKLADTVVELGLTVKQLKARVDRLRNPEAFKAEPAPEKSVDPNVRAAQTELERLLGTRVHITDNKGKGKIVIEYRNLEDFDRVLELLNRS